MARTSEVQGADVLYNDRLLVVRFVYHATASGALRKGAQDGVMAASMNRSPALRASHLRHGHVLRD